MVTLLLYLILFLSESNLNEGLDYILKSGILSLVAIVVAISVFFYQQHKEKSDKKQEFNERLTRMCNLLFSDLELIQNWLFDESKDRIRRGNDISYMESVLGTESYNSVIYSGLITYFQKETQTTLNQFYFYISMHNKRLYDMNELKNAKLISTEINDTDIAKLEGSPTWKHNQIQLTLYENEMRKLFPRIKKQLNLELERVKS